MGVSLISHYLCKRLRVGFDSIFILDLYIFLFSASNSNISGRISQNINVISVIFIGTSSVCGCLILQCTDNHFCLIYVVIFLSVFDSPNLLVEESDFKSGQYGCIF